METGDRIRSLRKALGLTQTEFAKELGLTQNYIHLVEKGERQISDRTLADMQRTFSVSKEWLIDGVGEMFSASTKQTDLAKLSKAVLDEPNGGIKSKIISLLANLPEEYWEMIADMAERLASEPDEEGGG